MLIRRFLPCWLRSHGRQLALVGDCKPRPHWKEDHKVEGGAVPDGRRSGAFGDVIQLTCVYTFPGLVLSDFAFEEAKVRDSMEAIIGFCSQ